MAKSFLRSGNLDAVLALGENGQPVYASALQLRETLRLRKQPKIADCLAIPQANESGDRIDWYAPFSGRVKSWIAASDSERASAINLLESCQNGVNEISQRAQSAGKPAMQLFGVLLSKAFQFPDQNYIYLVDGKPVITFWGFVDLDKKSRADALDCLRATLQVNLPPIVPVCVEPPVVVTPVAAPLPEPELPVAEIAVPAPAPAAVPPVKKAPASWRRFWWLLPPLAIAGAFAVQQQQRAEPVELPAAETAARPAPLSEVQPAPVAAVAPAPQAEEKTTLPLAPATHDETLPVAAPAVEPPVEAAAAEPAAPVAKDALVMPADAVKIGSTKFLNGSWRVTLDVKNLPTGKPPSLKYQLKNGKGTARIVQGDGISCKADITAGLMSSGNLVINSRYTARCSDSSRYKMPEITCKQGATGAAVCEASYGNDTVFPMTIKRENK
ncbi:SrfA family protein [Erwiniaceae bacterium BAC15a-03b]|uniref:SrfA family protein n=1 Tax=Winslowiella arboricola TaxID=2978220 RepID=A0A9J6PQ99_9GAMM|nr:SrfA family protein [Winslowiella arboricola]MCU5775540.1 SrfA family protein [Winslowiella arboricola]MCU5779610.1 SrfA family protein [Winslowiella arboricola]